MPPYAHSSFFNLDGFYSLTMDSADGWCSLVDVLGVLSQTTSEADDDAETLALLLAGGAVWVLACCRRRR